MIILDQPKSEKNRLFGPTKESQKKSSFQRKQRMPEKVLFWDQSKKVMERLCCRSDKPLSCMGMSKLVNMVLNVHRNHEAY